MLTSERLRLSHVKRWNIVATMREQTVAEHSFNVWVITRALCEAIDLSKGLRDAAEQWALHHDLPEAKLGDIPTPSKSMIVNMSEVEQRIAGDEWATLYETIKNTIVEDVVKLADLIEAWCFLKLWGTGVHARQVKDQMETHVWTALGNLSDKNGFDLQKWQKLKTCIATIMSDA